MDDLACMETAAMDGFTRTRRLDRFSVLLLACMPALASAAPQLAIAPFGYRVEQAVRAPDMPRAYDVTLRAGVVNTGDPASAVVAQLTSSTQDIMVLDGQVGFGNVARTAALRPAMSLDTFKVRFVFPSAISVAALLQYLQTAVGSLHWRLACGNCGQNRPPVANAGADQTAHVGERITLDGSGSHDPDAQPLSYSWSLLSFPSGSRVSLSAPTAVQPTFVADRDGEYVMRLLVSDGIDASAPDTVTVTTRNSAPVARAGADITALTGTRVRLDGSASTDVDGDGLTYEWTLLSRPPLSAALFASVDPALPFAEFTVDRPGQYVAELVVDDGRLESVPDTVVISTANSPPVADAGPDQAAVVGAQVLLSASASRDVDGDPLTYRWSLSAPAGSQAALAGSTGASAVFVVDRPGTYVAQLIVNDGRADSAADTVVISTTNSAPVADAGTNRTVDPGEAIVLDGAASHDADGDPLAFNWSLLSVPPGSATALIDPQTVHPAMTPDLVGAYVGQLIVNDGQVNSAPSTVTITARSVAPPVPDAQPPETPDVARIALSRMDAARLRVSGAPGSVEGKAQVTILNFSTGASVTVTADADGSFVALIAAADDDALIASARDAAGNTGAVATLGALSALELTIDTPRSDQPIAGSTVLVSGRMRAPRNTGVTVNGKPAAVRFDPAGSSFVAQVELTPPQEAGEAEAPVPLTVIASTPDGRTEVRTMSVRIAGRSDYALALSPTDGPAPLRVDFELIDRKGLDLRSIEFDFDGDGTVDLTTSAPEQAIEWLYTTPGTYCARAKITDDAGRTVTVSAPVYVRDRTALAADLGAVWNGMLTALGQRNPAAALMRLSESAQKQYGPAFAVLADELPRIVDSFSQPEIVEIGSETAELAVMRTLDGVDRAFFIYVTRCPDGVWRVEGM